MTRLTRCTASVAAYYLAAVCTLLMLLMFGGSEAWAAVVFNTNLVTNPGAESGASLGGSSFVVDNWTITTGPVNANGFSGYLWGSGGGFPTYSSPGPAPNADRGSRFFYGGNNSVSSAARQTITGMTPAVQAMIDSGTATYNLSGWLGGFSSDNDNATLAINFLNAANATIGAAAIGPVIAANRSNTTGLLLRQTSGIVPIGTRSVDVSLSMARVSGTANDSYADNLALMFTLPPVLPSPGPSTDLAKSDFSVNDEGWTLVGDSASATPTYFAAGGNPGGYIRGTDGVLNGTWYWDAPAKFLGDKHGAYGYTLTYDQRMRGSGPLFDDNDVILSGAGFNLFYDTSPVPGDPAWTSYTLPLNEAAGWKLNSPNGPAPTQAQFLAALGSLTRLRIRGEFITGADTGDLDNVVVHGVQQTPVVPEPSTFVLAALGVLGLGFTTRQKKEA